jgi:hypothetical protein
VKTWVAAGALWLWILVLFITHWGARSPYSYGWAIFHGNSARLLGTVVNPDALVVYPVTLYFYEGRTPQNWGDSPNFRLPFHSFLVATIASFTRSYLASNYIANIGALMLLALVALKRGQVHLERLIALLTIVSVPFVVTYVAQPMHYTVGIVINFLAVIAACSLSDDDLRNPLISGLLLAIVALNYDAYIFAAALGAYMMFVIRFRRARDYALFVVVAIAPVAIWVEFLRWLTNDRVSRMIERTFIQPVVHGWLEYLKHPLQYNLQPFIAGHVGLHVGLHFILAMIYWPILVLCLAGLWRLRRDIPYTRETAMAALLLLIFVLHQLVTAGFDWENNPRRAIPVVLAIAFVYCWLADRLWTFRPWRIAFVTVLVISCVLAMADTLFHTPAVTFLSTGQAIQHNPKEAMTIRFMRFDSATMPTLMADEPPVWHDLGKARLTRSAAPSFLFAQVFNAFFCCALLWLLARAKLLPRYSPAIGAAIWLVSVVRFL